MSNFYPKWWNSTITIYNKYENPQTDKITWYRKTLDKCFWKYTGEKVIIGQSILETNDTICRIPKKDNFIPRYEWVNLTPEQKGNYFTIGVEDIIVFGNVSDEIDEYTSGKRHTDLIAKYKKLQGCMVINSFAINVGGGRAQEHYFTKGE